MNREKLISMAGAVTPPGAEIHLLEMPHDGVHIRAVRWPVPDGMTTRGTIALFNGRTEFIEKYYEIIADLRARGLAVVTLDWRGQGLSDRLLTDRRRGYVRDFADYVADARVVLDRLMADLPRPHLLLAHSMGGNIGLRLLQEDTDRFERAVLGAPMTGITRSFPSPAVTEILAFMAVVFLQGDQFAPRQALVDALTELFEDNQVTSDPARFAQAQSLVRSEPALALGGVTWRWLREALASIRFVLTPSRAGAIRTPVLLASAGADTIVDSASHAVLEQRAPAVRRIVFEGAMHEILQERDTIRDRFWNEFDAFLEER